MKQAERLKRKRTEIVQDYLSIVNKDYINTTDKISLKIEFIYYYEWPESTRNMLHVPILDRNVICESKLSELDIYRDELLVDLDKSIISLLQ